MIDVKNAVNTYGKIAHLKEQISELVVYRTLTECRVNCNGKCTY